MKAEIRKMRIITSDMERCTEQEENFGWYPVNIQTEDDESVITFQRQNAEDVLDRIRTLEEKYHQSNRYTYYEAWCVRRRIVKADDEAARTAFRISGGIGVCVLFMMLCNGSIFDHALLGVIPCVVLYFVMRFWYAKHLPSFPAVTGTTPMTEEEEITLLNEAYQLSH